MMNTQVNKNAEKCPACSKPLAKVGRGGKFRCSNPECPIVFIRLDDDRKSKLRSGSRWRG